MAKEAKSAVPATPVRSSGTRTKGLGRSGPSIKRSDSFDEPMDYSDAKEDDEEDDLEEKAAMPELSEATAVSAGRSGEVTSLARNLTEELNEVAGPEPAHGYDEDGSDDANSRPNGGRPPLNGDTPAANRVLGRYLEFMKVKSNWMRSFAPEIVRQAIWMELGGELTVPVESWSTRQVAEDTVQLLRVMGCEPQVFPSEADLRAWAPEDAATALRKWKQKLRSAFGVAEAGVSRPPNVRHASDPVDPSTIPLPLTPGRRPRESTEAGILSAKGATSTYFQDSHMVTPRSVSRTERLARETEGHRTAPTAGRSASRTPRRRYDLRDDSSDEDSFDVGDTGGDLTGEWARQIRELSAVENDSATPRLEIATHLPLGNIKPYLGLRDKSEKSMQWLRAFNQSAKARYYSAKREEKEHVCDYLNRLNGYARNAGVQFEHGGRDAKDHVEHFLDSCEDRGLEERLCHVQVKNIHDLEDMINDILRRRERKSGRESSVRRPRGQEVYRPRVTLTDALTDITTALNVGRTADTRGGYPEAYNGGYDDTEEYGPESHSGDDDRYSEEYSDDGYASTEDRGHVAAANDTERRNAAEGTFMMPGGVSKRPDDLNMEYVKTTENVKERGVSLGESEVNGRRVDGDGVELTDASILSMAKIDHPSRDLGQTIKLLSGERMGWWSSQRYDKRKRLRALVNGAVNDSRTRILLDTGANVSVISASYAKRLRLREVPDHGRSLEVRGINPGVMETRRRALVKVTLGWERVYEFEVWVMDHSAGVDVVLGTDFMIPAGVRLDLFHGTARLPDEVMVPLVKSQNPAEAEPYSMQVTGRPTEDLSVPGHDDSVATDTSDGADTTYTSEENSIPVLGDDPETRLDSAFVAMMHEITKGDGSGSGNTDTNASEHLANEIELTDYAHELAFLPDLTEASETVLDYSGPNVLNPSATARQQESLVAVLKRHEKIMIASGNALPPPAYGVVCDIDVQGHPPIKQRARRTPLRHLRKLYELLKGLLKARLVAFSDSPWASPIVIVLKKNGVDIRLCIDYKLVNAVTAIMEYAMPLVDDLLTDLEAYLWFCSLDAASGFWTIMMTMRARKVSAFVCALGHFEWLRMPFGWKNAPMIYQRMIDNALWGFVQPKGGWLHFSELMRTAEAHAEVVRTGVTDPSLRQPEESTTRPTKFEADRESSVTLDAVNGLVNSPVADMFSTGEPDESSLVPVFDRRSFVDDICFGSETFDACLETLDRLLQRFTECRISVSFTKSIFVQPKVDFLSHEVSAEGIRADTKKMKAVTELPFPASKKGMQSFLGALNYYSRFIQDFAVYGAALYQLKDEDFTPSGSLSAAKRSFAALQQKVAEAPILRHFDRDKEVHVTLFANEWALSFTLMQYHDDKLHPVRFCGRVLKDAEMNYHPAEKEVLALLLVLKVCYSQLVGRTIHVYTRFSTLEWVHKSKTLFGRATHFTVMLSPWHLVVNRVKERDCTFAQLLQAGLTSFVELEDSLAPVTPPTKGSPTARMDPHLLYACLPRSYTGFVMSFDGSAKTEKN
uniref:Peptidase A2 domain-containing protein n=1 Tax=Phytophthora ramorum TaxID=164328 RepID=H3H486_PHYRM